MRGWREREREREEPVEDTWEGEDETGAEGRGGEKQTERSASGSGIE